VRSGDGNDAAGNVIATVPIPASSAARMASDFMIMPLGFETAGGVAPGGVKARSLRSISPNMHRMTAGQHRTLP
jgi:hypothetical protein